ncbi:MAG: GerAB/ArcD/ProY family transporter [Clostridia bacterium]|nr:GerAB/ArcD/ProY family transporter [Clostridia bacterium]
MDLVRAVQITEYLHRLESFMVALWYWSMLVQGGILTYCATLAFRQTLGLNRRNIWLMMATGLILVAMTYFLAFNRMTFLNFLENQWPYLSLPAHLGLPLLLMIFALFRKRG